MTTLDSLIEHLRSQNLLNNSALEAAFREIDRAVFLPPEQLAYAYEDRALPLRAGQTISQPSTVALMLNLLDLQKGQRILDIGAGSGWASCVLTYLTGETGEVFAYEINPEVGQLGQQNIAHYDFSNLHYTIDDASQHWHHHAPYDRIHAAAAFETIPEALPHLLSIDGLLVAPTQDNEILRITRTNENDCTTEHFPGFVFVPFLEKPY